MKKCVKYLKYNFTEEELKEKAAELARECRQKEEIEDDKKRVTSDFKAKLDGIQAKISLLSNNINNGYEHRNVECEIVMNSPRDGKKTILRVDTGEQVAVEDMLEAEMQETMDFKDPDVVDAAVARVNKAAKKGSVHA